MPTTITMTEPMQKILDAGRAWWNCHDSTEPLDPPLAASLADGLSLREGLFTAEHWRDLLANLRSASLTCDSLNTALNAVGFVEYLDSSWAEVEAKAALTEAQRALLAKLAKGGRYLRGASVRVAQALEKRGLVTLQDKGGT